MKTYVYVQASHDFKDYFKEKFMPTNYPPAIGDPIIVTDFLSTAQIFNAPASLKVFMWGSFLG